MARILRPKVRVWDVPIHPLALIPIAVGLYPIVITDPSTISNIPLDLSIRRPYNVFCDTGCHHKFVLHIEHTNRR
jgi:hypothetical protein